MYILRKNAEIHVLRGGIKMRQILQVLSGTNFRILTCLRKYWLFVCVGILALFPNVSAADMPSVSAFPGAVKVMAR
jgi:hypothetical protein